MPQYKHVYDEHPSKRQMNKLRTVYFIETEREKQIGIGEDYTEPEI